MGKNRSNLLTYFWKITSTHTITYFLFGLLALVLFNYKELYNTVPLSYLMLPVNSKIIAAGPMLQIIRGIIISLILLPFKTIIFDEKNGWIKLWILLIGLSIISTYAPAPGSFEGMIFTKIPIIMQIKGLPEVFAQSLLFSIIVYKWNKTENIVWYIISIVLVILVILVSLAGILLK